MRREPLSRRINILRNKAPVWQIPIGSLICHYDMERLVGTTLPDLTSNGYTGTVSGASIKGKGIIGANGLWFNASSSNVLINDAFGTYTQNPFTFSVWFNMDSNPGSTVRLGDFYKNSSFRFEIGSAGAMGAEYWNGAAWISAWGANATLTPGRWFHYVAVMDATYLYCYKNGILQASISRAGSSPESSSNTNRLGSAYDLSTCFPGTLDSFRFYNRALTYPEILSLYDEAPLV